MIEQAKGALMFRFGLDPDAAFALLRSWSQKSNVRLRAVAEALVCAICQGDCTASHDPAFLR